MRGIGWIVLAPAYFDTRFRVAAGVHFPKDFVILSAYATTGEVWSVERNQRADQALRDRLSNYQVWTERVVGYSPVTQHAEPSWAVSISLELGCLLGIEFLQDAIYYVAQGRLQVTQCSMLRLEFVDSFMSRVDYEGL